MEHSIGSKGEYYAFPTDRDLIVPITVEILNGIKNALDPL